MSCVCYACALRRRRLAEPTSPGDLSFMGLPIVLDPTIQPGVIEFRQVGPVDSVLTSEGWVDLRQHWAVRWQRSITAADRTWARKVGISLE